MNKCVAVLAPRVELTVCCESCVEADCVLGVQSRVSVRLDEMVRCAQWSGD